MDDSVKVCDICDGMYVPAAAGEIDRHKKFHEGAVNGVRIRISKQDSIVRENEKHQLILVDSNSTRAQVSRLNKLSSFLSQSIPRDELFSYSVDLPYPIKPEHKFFLLISKGRIIGYLDIEFVSNGLETPVWLIKMIWLAINYRKNGLAKYIVMSSLNFLNLNLSSVMWNSPFSKQGLVFVQSLYPNGNGFRAF